MCAGLQHREATLLGAPLQKLYRFPTEDQRWLSVREELRETPLAFSVPRQLLRALVLEHRSRWLSSVCVWVRRCRQPQRHQDVLGNAGIGAEGMAPSPSLRLPSLTESRT